MPSNCVSGEEILLKSGAFAGPLVTKTLLSFFLNLLNKNLLFLHVTHAHVSVDFFIKHKSV